jgi:ParB family chromosome partitioning protein
MARLKTLADRSSDLFHIDPRILKVKPGLNARTMDAEDTREHIEWLATSIAETGVRNPLEVFSEGDEVYVVHGHCRLAATMLAISRGVEIKTVPCIAEPRGTNEVDRILNQNVDNTGKPLTPLEAGANIKRAAALGWTVSQIAKKLGKSISYVSQALDFQSAPSEVHQAVAAGSISATLAAQTLRNQGPVSGTAAIAEAATAKAQGRKRATARNLRPLRPPTPRPPSMLSRLPPDSLEIRQFPAGEISVRIGEHAHILPRKTWGKICNAILDVIEGKTARVKEANHGEEAEVQTG